MPEELPYTTLLLVRHAQARSDDGSYTPATPLSAPGRRQAAALAEALVQGTGPSAVYTSPHLRAAQTAEPICARLGLRPVEDSRLAEFEIGDMPMAEFAENRPDLLLWRPEHRGTPEGASLSEFSLRVAAFCDEVVERHLGGCVLLTTHAGTIDAAIRWAVGIPYTAPWQHEFDLGNGSITEVHHWPRGRIPGGPPRYSALMRTGDTAHLHDLTSDL